MAFIRYYTCDGIQAPAAAVKARQAAFVQLECLLTLLFGIWFLRWLNINHPVAAQWRQSPTPFVDTGEVKCIVIYECIIILLKKHTNFESVRETRLQGARAWGKRQFYKSSAISGVGSKYSHVHDPLTETSSFDSDRTLLH